MKKIKNKILFIAAFIVFVLAVLGIWIFFRPQAAESCSTVAVYRDANYGGTSACLAPGNYNVAALKVKGITNDSLSSVKIPSGMKAILYENDNFGGYTLSLTSNTSDLSYYTLRTGFIRQTWNDEASSIKVSYTTCPQPTSETRTLDCPVGQIGSIIQTRNKGPIPDCVWGDWKETSNTCENPPPPRPAPKVNLKANGSQGTISINYESTVKLSRLPSSADSCTASGDWSGGKDDEGGSWTSEKLTSKKTYTLTCKGNGSASETVIVEVKAQVVTPPVEPPVEPPVVEEPPPVVTPESTPEEDPVVETPTENNTPQETPEPTPETATPNTTPESTNQENPNSTNEPSQTGTELSPTQISSQTNTESQQESIWTNVWIWVAAGLILLFVGIYLFIRIRQYSLTGEDLVASYENPLKKTTPANTSSGENPSIQSPGPTETREAPPPQKAKAVPSSKAKPPSNIPMAQTGEGLPDDDMDID